MWLFMLIYGVYRISYTMDPPKFKPENEFGIEVRAAGDQLRLRKSLTSKAKTKRYCTRE